MQDFIFLYRPKLANFRHTIKLTKSKKFHCHAHISCKKLAISDVIDISKKEYIRQDISGFICYCEQGVFEDVSTFKEILTLDLEMLKKLLPLHSCQLLQQSTPIWINKEITFGTVDSPVVGSSICFHSIDGKVMIRYIPAYVYESIYIYINMCIYIYVYMCI
jgi:hypothetical protein